jgi:hypothetical protein
MIITSFFEGSMDGMCFELNIPYNLWMISSYEKGKFVKYENDYKLSDDRKKFFGTIINNKAQ